MAAVVTVPGFGAALAGLDWLQLEGIDGQSTEIRKLGHTANAVWVCLWWGAQDAYVAFAHRGDAKKRPTAAALLLKHVLNEHNYLLLLEVGEDTLWSFAVADGVPVAALDVVGHTAKVMAGVHEYLGALREGADKLPIYTDQQAVLTLGRTHNFRPFSLEILGHQITKKRFAKAAFSNYSRWPVKILLILFAGVAMGGGTLLYQAYTTDIQRQRDATLQQQQRATEAQQKLQKIAAAINLAPSVTSQVPAYLRALQAVPVVLAGWRLTEVKCSGANCTLNFSAQPFSTWDGYVNAKPTAWPAPILGTNIQQIEQSLPVVLPAATPRSSAHLPQRQDLVLALGNLAQVAKQVNITLALANRGEPVIVALSKSLVDSKIPVKAAFSITGDASLLADFVTRLPDAAGLLSLDFKLANTKPTFDLKGEAYATL